MISDSDSTLFRVLERLESLVDWERSSRLRMRVDLSGISDLLYRIGNPQDQFRSVHVTGTKGKGSVCCLVDAGLRQSGLFVGRYTSPHLQSVNERICLGGQTVPDVVLAAALCSALDARESALSERTPGAHATWFDVMTAAAFKVFAEAKVDWAVVEVGLGGRLDSTNILTSEIAVITNVGLEHTEILGATIEAIAAEKAGIIKPSKILVTPIPYASAAGAVVFSIAGQRGASVRQVQTFEHGTITETNVAVAREVLDALGTLSVEAGAESSAVSGAALSRQVIERSALPGRQERFRVQRPGGDGLITVVLDGAHVDFALEGVLRELSRDGAFRSPPVVLMGLGADKNPVAMLTTLRGVAARVICVALPDGKPAWAPERLEEVARSMDIPAEAAREPKAALARCLEISADTWTLVTGSLHLVGCLRSVLTA